LPKFAKKNLQATTVLITGNKYASDCVFAFSSTQQVYKK